MKEARSSLEGLSFDLTVRRSGKTRRIIDNAINILYEDGRVRVQDHNILANYKEGVEEISADYWQDQLLAKKIWDRLCIEDEYLANDKNDFDKHYVDMVLSILVYPPTKLGFLE